MSEPAISIENVSKRYVIGHQRDARDGLRHVLEDAVRNPFGWLLDRKRRFQESREEFWALRDLSFHIQPGDVVGIVGRNGAGKSTLLKILSRITEPTSGRIEINGRVASLLEVGTGFHQELTGRENIFLNGAILGMSRAEIKQKFDEIVAFSEIEKFLDTPVKRYSSGMYVRLAFAVAAHLEPEILIVDEVLAVGDAQFQRKCLGKMGEISRGGRTVLFVSHNMSAVRSLCQKAVFLSKGTLRQVGSVDSIVNEYLADIQDTPVLEISLQDKPRAGHFGEKLRIDGMRINQGKGIWHGRPLEVEFTFECFADVQDVSFGIGFCHREGTRILSIDSDIPGERWNFSAGQRGTVSLRTPVLRLEPDIYTLEIGSRSGDAFGLDYVPQCGHVTIVPSDDTPAVIAMREHGRGGVRQPAESNVVFTGSLHPESHFVEVEA